MKRLNVLAKPEAWIAWFLLLAAMKTVMVTPASAQELPLHSAPSALEGDGTGVGNGIPNTVLDGETANMRRQAGLLSIVNPSPSIDEIMAWCSGVANMLQSSLELSAAYSNSYSVEWGEAILVRALEVARDSIVIRTGYEGPVAQKMVTRGLNIYQALIFNGPLMDTVPTESRYQFLRSYIRLAVREIRSFDRLLAIPFQWGYLPCNGTGAASYATCPATGIPSGFDIVAYNARYLEFVQTQIRYIMGRAMVGRTPRRYGEQFFAPSLDSRAMLRVAEHVARGVAQDLNESVLRLAGACTYQILNTWADRLQTFNLTGVSPFGNAPSLVAQTMRTFNTALNEISSCGTH